ncbi:MAG: HesA/MoeB/ThiF family protein [Phycisphaerales bacterium]|nr:HesA/MoeB/ThiF family protein [Phycisphaerales bacterium]
MSMSRPPLTDEERAVYEWQLDVPGHGEAGQSVLKGATALVSRVGGLGSPVAYELAAAGIGRIVLAHGGTLKPSDLNRQLLMTHEALGTPRVHCAARRLQELNPRLEVVAVESNVTDANAAELVAMADVVVDAAPLFEERLALNDAAFDKGIPIVECAMYDLEATITTQLAGRTGRLRDLVPEPPQPWQRRFPVFGAVSGAVGCLGAMEAIKCLAGLGEPLFNRMLFMDLRTMKMREMALPGVN